MSAAISVYVLENCTLLQPDGSIISKKCDYVKFPKHPHLVHRQPCGTLLMKKVRTSSGTTTLYPKQIFCYKSIIESLKEMLVRPGFLEKCEAWRSRKVEDGLLADIYYDGNIWKDFLNPNGVPFLSVPYNFALTLNIDWFQPFTHTNHSTGAMYLAIQNLPRNERYTRENIILVGIIPGPHEPSKTMNDYLKPLVRELQELSKANVIVRAALLCTACDIPACRKVSGFVGHNALHGCFKAFPTSNFGEKPDFTGFDRSLWEPRSIVSHRQHALATKTAKQHSSKNLLRGSTDADTLFCWSCLTMMSYECLLWIPCTTYC